MGNLSKAPTTVGIAIEQYLFLLENDRPKYQHEYSAIKKSLEEFTKQYSYISLSNLEELKDAIAKHLNTKYNFGLYNDRLHGLKALVYWLEDKNYIAEGLLKNYIPIY